MMLPHAHPVNIFSGGCETEDRTVSDGFVRVEFFFIIPNWASLRLIWSAKTLSNNAANIGCH